MATTNIKRGDTLSTLAAQHGTTVDALLAANKNNPSVKSRDLILAGGTLNLPGPETAPRSVKSETPASELAPAATGAAGETGGNLGNLRIALRSALNEAAKKRMANQFEQVSGALGGEFVPGTIGSITQMIRAGVETPVESTFRDITTALQDQQNFAQQMIAKYPDAGILMTDGSETIARKASRAPSFLKSMQGQPTLAEKEQEEARRMAGVLDRARGPGGFVNYPDYKRQRSQSLLNPDEFDRRFSGLYLSEGDRERLKSESASASTRTAEDFSKAEQIVQANIDQIKTASVTDRSRVITETISIIQRRTNLTEAEIKVIMERYGFQRREGVGWMYVGG